MLAAAQLLMAAGASPVILAVGAVGGIALLLASLPRSRTALAGLLVVGTVPFAVLAWTAVVPVVLLLLAAALAVPLIRSTAPAASRSHADASAGQR